MDSATVETWFAIQRHELLTGNPDRVLAALRQLPPGAARDTALGYLASRRAQIAYRTFTDQGWPIGSGCGESAHQHIIQDRMKGRGMRWERTGAEALVALRIVTANARWAATWGQVGPAQRADRRQRTARRRTDRRAQLRTPRPPLIVHGNPTQAHPWKRYPACKTVSRTRITTM